MANIYHDLGMFHETYFFLKKKLWLIN